MNLTATARVSLRALTRNKVRSLLTALGIIVGIAAVIAMVGVGKGATIMIQKEVASMGDNLLIVMPGSFSGPGSSRGGAGSIKTLTNEDGEAILREVSYCRTMTPMVRAGGQVIFRDKNWSTGLQGVNTSYLEVRNWAMDEGEFFTDADVRVATRVCVLGRTVARELFGDEDPVGKVIRIKNMPFRVLGVLTVKGTASFGQDQDDTIVIPYTTVRAVLQNSTFNNVDTLMVNLTSQEAMEPAQDEIDAILRQRHRLGENEDDDFSILSMNEITKTISQVSVVMTVLLTVIASISLFVGGIGIMNIMLVSVTERTREIGLRMAVGARRRDILMQFLVESMMLSGIGGSIGVALGVAAATILSRTAGWPILISVGYSLISLGFSCAVGIFFGFYPAWRAARLNPIEALRYE